MTGVGFGYNFRGEYDYSNKVQKYSPGDIFSIVPEVRYYFSDQWVSRLFANFSTYSQATSNSQPFSTGRFFPHRGRGYPHPEGLGGRSQSVWNHQGKGQTLHPGD